MKNAKVIVFGELIPAGDDSDIYVSYNAPGIPGGMLYGPCEDMAHATSELHDIMTYEGVNNAKIVTRAELRVGFYPYTDD